MTFAPRTLLAILALTALPLAPAFAGDESLPGTYSVTLTDKGRTKTGTAKVRQLSGRLALELTLTGGVVLTGEASTGGSTEARSFTLATSPARTLVLTPTKLLNATGVLKEDDKTVGSASLTRQRAVLVVHADAWDQSHASFFKLKANDIARYYANKGYKRRDVVQGTSFEALIAQLDAAADEGRPYDRVVIVAHGGWDGPIFSGPSSTGPSQASGDYNAGVFARVAAAVRRGTTPLGRVYISACHSGGSNKYERQGETEPSYIYADDLARRAERWVAGPAGITSNEFALKGVQAALEQERGVHQEMRVAVGSAAQTFAPGRWVVQPTTTAATR